MGMHWLRASEQHPSVKSGQNAGAEIGKRIVKIFRFVDDYIILSNKSTCNSPTDHILNVSKENGMSLTFTCEMPREQLSCGS